MMTIEHFEELHANQNKRSKRAENRKNGSTIGKTSYSRPIKHSIKQQRLHLLDRSLTLLKNTATTLFPH